MEETDSWFHKGYTLFRKGDYSGAISAFDKSISFNQSTIDAWYYRGLAYQEMGQYKDAVRSFEETLRFNPDHADAKAARDRALGLKAQQEADAKIVYSAGPSRRRPAEPVQAAARAGTMPGLGPARNEKLAALFSFFFPGWGQWYNGQTLEGFFFIGTMVILGLVNIVVKYVLKFGSTFDIVYGLLSLAIVIFGMHHAYTRAGMINQGTLSFTRKSGLFWVPVGIYVLVIILLIFGMTMGFINVGLTGTIAPVIGNTTSPGSSSSQRYVVAATAAQPESSIIVVTYHGGPDAAHVRQLIVTVTDPSRTIQTKTLGDTNATAPLDTGTSISFTGNYVGKDHVVATARFMDGTQRQILDTYV